MNGKPRPRKPGDAERPGNGPTRSATPPGGASGPTPGARDPGWVADDASDQTGWVDLRASTKPGKWVEKEKSGEGWVGLPGQAGPTPASDSDQETVNFDAEEAKLAASGGRKRLGDYELEKKVGQGGMGEVWLARQLSLDRPVAVKVLPRSLANQENFIERFQHEAKAAASLVHPNVLQIYSFGVAEGTPYFAMEFIEGEDLQQRMRRKRLEWEEIAQIMIGVGNALTVAHEKGLIHRDIKPSNIMIDRNGIVKVMDFGLAKAMSGEGQKNLTSAGLIMGTPNYLSPEQGRGDPLDGRSDLYSLGIVLYELCTGQLPFRADTPAGLIFKHVYEPPPPPRDLNPDIPKYLVDILMRLLQKDPDDRFPGAADFVAAMTEFLANCTHYVEGGEAAPPQSPRSAEARAAARSGLAGQVTVGTRKRSEQKTQREAITEPVEREQVAEAVEAEAVEPPRPSARRPAATPPRKKGSKAPLVVVLLLVAAGAGLWFGRPDLVRELAQRAGITLDPAPVQSAGPIAQPDPTAKGQVAYVLRPDALPPGVAAALVAVRATHQLRPNVEGVYPLGEYGLELSRAGYDPVHYKVRLVRKDDGKGVLVDLQGNDALRVVPVWHATAELSEAYAAGRSLLAQGTLEQARAQLERAARLDAAFRPTLDDPTVAQLIDELDKKVASSGQSTARLEERFALSEEHAAARRWRAAEQLLAGLPEADQPATWKQLLERCRAEVARGEALRAAVEGEVERGNHAQAEKKLAELTHADPEHPLLPAVRTRFGDARAQRELALAEVSGDVAAAIGRLQTYLDTFGKADDEARRRLETLKSRLSRERAVAEDLARLEEAVSQKNWHEAKRLAGRVLKEQADHARAQQLRRQAETELERRAILEAVANLDGAVVRGALDDVVAFLDHDAPGYARERDAFAAMAEVQARFTASQHRELEVEVEESNARVAGWWDFSVEVLGEPARSLTARHHILLRRVEGGRWLITELKIEGNVRAKQ